MALAVTDQATAYTAPEPASTLQELRQARESIERMRVRVNALHAHHDSLDRAARGIRTIHDRLQPVLQLDVAEHGWSPEHRLVESALEATRQQLRFVLEVDHALPIEKQRTCLNHALARAAEAMELLDRER
jgi:hypothetical protein